MHLLFRSVESRKEHVLYLNIKNDSLRAFSANAFCVAVYLKSREQIGLQYCRYSLGCIALLPAANLQVPNDIVLCTRSTVCGHIRHRIFVSSNCAYKSGLKTEANQTSNGMVRLPPANRKSHRITFISQTIRTLATDHGLFTVRWARNKHRWQRKKSQIKSKCKMR